MVGSTVLELQACRLCFQNLYLLLGAANDPFDQAQLDSAKHLFDTLQLILM
jgi:hypothetical protein